MHINPVLISVTVEVNTAKNSLYDHIISHRLNSSTNVTPCSICRNMGIDRDVSKEKDTSNDGEGKMEQRV